MNKFDTENLPACGSDVPSESPTKILAEKLKRVARTMKFQLVAEKLRKLAERRRQRLAVQIINGAEPKPGNYAIVNKSLAMGFNSMMCVKCDQPCTSKLCAPGELFSFHFVLVSPNGEIWTSHDGPTVKLIAGTTEIGGSWKWLCYSVTTTIRADSKTWWAYQAKEMLGWFCCIQIRAIGIPPEEREQDDPRHLVNHLTLDDEPTAVYLYQLLAESDCNLATSTTLSLKACLMISAIWAPNIMGFQTTGEPTKLPSFHMRLLTKQIWSALAKTLKLYTPRPPSIPYSSAWPKWQVCFSGDHFTHLPERLESVSNLETNTKHYLEMTRRCYEGVREVRTGNPPFQVLFNLMQIFLDLRPASQFNQSWGEVVQEFKTYMEEKRRKMEKQKRRKERRERKMEEKEIRLVGSE